MLIRRLRTLDPAARRLLFEAAVELARANVRTRWLPFAEAIAQSNRRAGVAGLQTPEACAWGVRAVASRVPFRARCLQQALALQRMLHRRGQPARLHYGLAMEAELEAHAWVSLHGTILIGAEEAGRFQEVASWP